MKYFKSICLLMAVSLIIPSLCSCKDDDEDSPLYINGIDMEGIWAMGKYEGAFEEVDELYKFTKDGVVVIYETDNWFGYPLVKGIMQCASSDFDDMGTGTWSINGNSILVKVDAYSYIYTITKVVSRDEAKAYGTYEREDLIFRRVKGFKK